MQEFKNKEAIENIFTQENCTAIVEVLNHIFPRETFRTKQNEYETVVAAAKADAHNAIILNIIEFCTVEKIKK